MDKQDLGKGKRTSSIVARFSVAGAILGLAAGFYEAGLYYFPQGPSLIRPEPDVGALIWFVAPLMGLLGFGLLGLAFGIAASVRHSRWRAATMAAAGLGAVGAYVVSLRYFLHRPVIGWSLIHFLTPAAIGFAATFTLAMLVFKMGWRGGWLDAPVRWPGGLLAKSLSAVFLLSACGLIYFLLINPGSSSSRANVSGRAGKPNIVLITLDTVRADHLSSYGYSRPTTPNIDRLAARRGAVFESAISASSWTLPSFASMFTGLLAHQHGASAETGLTTGVFTLARALESQGYETAGFSANAWWCSRSLGLNQGFNVYDDSTFSLRHNLRRTLWGRALQRLYSSFRVGEFDRKNAAELNSAIFDWFEHRSKSPFFLFVNYYDAHSPYLAPPPYDRHFGPTSVALLRRAYPFFYGRRAGQRLSEKETASLIDDYDNCLAYLDGQVGKLLSFLANSPGGSNTVVIITSDHGEAFGEHGCYGHGCGLHLELLRVPLIFFGPGIPAGRRISKAVPTQGIPATVLDLVSGESKPSSRSSLRRFWTPGSEEEGSDEAVVSEQTPTPAQIVPSPPVISLITEQWHYIRGADGHEELYHWPNDGREEVDLSASAPGPGVLRDLEGRLYSLVCLSYQPWLGSDYLLALGPRAYASLAQSGNLPLPGGENAQADPQATEELKSVPYQ